MGGRGVIIYTPFQKLGKISVNKEFASIYEEIHKKEHKKRKNTTLFLCKPYKNL